MVACLPAVLLTIPSSSSACCFYDPHASPPDGHQLCRRGTAIRCRPAQTDEPESGASWSSVYGAPPWIPGLGWDIARAGRGSVQRPTKPWGVTRCWRSGTLARQAGKQADKQASHTANGPVTTCSFRHKHDRACPVPAPHPVSGIIIVYSQFRLMNADRSEER